MKLTFVVSILIEVTDKLRKFLADQDPVKLFVLTMVTAMFLPRLVKKGMFGDGLLYASIARNMAEGRGSIWKPFFSTSYWLENIPDHYYENPPLMLWLESLLFRLLGDQWWVEKLFCVFVIILNILLFRLLWRMVFSNHPSEQTLWYLPVFFWYLIPVVIWGNVNNLMDNLLLSFCIGAVLFQWKAIHCSGSVMVRYCLMAGVMIFLGLITKGPVALFPIVTPLVYWLFWRREVPFVRMFGLTALSSISAVMLMIGLLSLYPDALTFFEQYWHQRLKAVISGSRSDMILSGWSRFYIVYQLILELSPTLIVVSVAYLWMKFNHRREYKTLFRREAWSFFLIGLSATLPILASTKQSGIYLLPGIPMFSFGFAILATPAIISLKQYLSERSLVMRLNTIILVAAAITLVYSVATIGQTRREATLISDVEQLHTIIPAGSKVAVCDEMMKDFMIHTYLQRMRKYELVLPSSVEADFLLEDNQCIKAMSSSAWKQDQKIPLKYFKLYSR